MTRTAIIYILADVTKLMLMSCKFTFVIN